MFSWEPGERARTKLDLALRSIDVTLLRCILNTSHAWSDEFRFTLWKDDASFTNCQLKSCIHPRTLPRRVSWDKTIRDVLICNIKETTFPNLPCKSSIFSVKDVCPVGWCHSISQLLLVNFGPAPDFTSGFDKRLRRGFHRPSDDYMVRVTMWISAPCVSRGYVRWDKVQADFSWSAYMLVGKWFSCSRLNKEKSWCRLSPASSVVSSLYQ